MIAKVVRHAGDLTNKTVVEVGPGPGSLTREILTRGVRHLHAVELDRRFFPLLDQLKECVTPGVFDYVHADVLQYDIGAALPSDAARDWMSDELPPCHLIGNLPFNVSTPLIIRWLQQMHERKGAWRFGRVPATLTFQHEVADRMVAVESARNRCRLSLMCQIYCHVNYAFTIKGRYTCRCSILSGDILSLLYEDSTFKIDNCVQVLVSCRRLRFASDSSISSRVRSPKFPTCPSKRSSA